MDEEINCDKCMFARMCSHQHKEKKCGGKMFKPISIKKKIEIIRQYDSGLKKEKEENED